MDSLYQQALLGELASPQPGGTSFNVSFNNMLSTPINVFWLDTNGHRSFVTTVVANGSSGPEIPAESGDYFIASCGLTAAFVGVLVIGAQGDNNDTYVFSAQNLTAPFDVGPLPVSTADIPIPGDSPSVVVGSGKLNNRNLVVRTQCWQRSPDSFCLAPGEQRDVTLTITEGRQDTSSDVESATSSISASASAGWGPFSASVSTSLSTTSTHAQSVTIQAQTSRFVSESLKSEATNTQIYMKWSLLDVVSVFDAGGAPLSTLVQTLAPTLIVVSDYPPPSAAPRRPRPVLSASALAKLPAFKRVTFSAA